jgi:hypothetical protein
MIPDNSTIVFKDHAVLRMLERGISKNEVVETLKHGEIIEEYIDDYPYSSKLMFKIINGKPIHIIVADNKIEKMIIIVTVYIPDSVNFEPDFKTRKNK